MRHIEGLVQERKPGGSANTPIEILPISIRTRSRFHQAPKDLPHVSR